MATEPGHSLWLVPSESEARKRLDEVIFNIARKYLSPVFVPHLTLAPDIPFTQISGENILDFTRSLALQIGNFNLTLKYIEGVPGSLYQCLYIKTELTAELQKAVNLARTVLKRDLNNPPFKPHISICYREDLSQDEKTNIISEIGDKLSGLTFTVQGIQIWTNGEPISNWRQVDKEVPLNN